MAPTIQVRSPEEWQLELQRLHRIGRAAEIDVVHGAAWKGAVAALVDALALVITVSPEGEGAALDAAVARLQAMIGRLLPAAVGDGSAARGGAGRVDVAAAAGGLSGGPRARRELHSRGKARGRR